MNEDALDQSFADPRTHAEFVPEMFPKADGHADEPVKREGQVVEGKLRFRIIYYHLNLAHRDLLSARRRGEDDFPILRRIEKILIKRDALEDLYTPLGLIQEPVVRDGITEDLQFLSPAASQPAVVSSAFLKVGLPPGVDLEQLRKEERSSNIRKNE